jgi:predicted RNA methylase
MHLFTFRYKQELNPEGIPQLGLFAEEVENVDLVTGDAKGKAHTVRYDAVIAMLLDEFIKEHRAVHELNRKIQEQDVTIRQLKKEMEIVVTYLKEHDSKIQKGCTQLDASRRAPHAVVQFVAGPCRSNQ